MFGVDMKARDFMSTSNLAVMTHEYDTSALIQFLPSSVIILMYLQLASILMGGKTYWF